MIIGLAQYNYLCINPASEINTSHTAALDPAFICSFSPGTLCSLCPSPWLCMTSRQPPPCQEGEPAGLLRSGAKRIREWEREQHGNRHLLLTSLRSGRSLRWNLFYCLLHSPPPAPTARFYALASERHGRSSVRAPACQIIPAAAIISSTWL